MKTTLHHYVLDIEHLAIKMTISQIQQIGVYMDNGLLQLLKCILKCKIS